MAYRNSGSFAGTWRHRLIVVLLLSGVMFPGMSAGEEQPAAEPGPAGQAQHAEPQPAKPEELIWPAPPEQARIKYLGSIHHPDDIGRQKGFWRSVWEFLRGEDESEDVVRPMGVAVDSKDRVIIADSARGRVHVFDRQAGEYSFIRGTEDELMSLPIGVAVGADDRIYVADGDRAKIYAFKPDGAFDADLGRGWFKRPAGLAIDRARQRLYVADPAAHDIKVVDLVKGELEKTMGKRGTAHGEFNYPDFVAVDRQGRLYVTDAMNMRVQIFDAEGKYLTAFGKGGDGPGDFSAPKGVAADSEGHIYVADAQFDNVQIFDEQGQLLLFWGTAGQSPGRFWLPTGLFMDGQDRLYVADSYNNRVQIFQYLGKQAMAEVKK